MDTTAVVLWLLRGEVCACLPMPGYTQISFVTSCRWHQRLWSFYIMERELAIIQLGSFHPTKYRSTVQLFTDPPALVGYKQGCHLGTQGVLPLYSTGRIGADFNPMTQTGSVPKFSKQTSERIKQLFCICHPVAFSVSGISSENIIQIFDDPWIESTKCS